MLKRFTLLIAIILPTFYTFTLAGEKAGSINLGRNIALKSGSEYWNDGLSPGGNVFGYKNPHIFYGLRMAYSTRSSDQFSGKIMIFEAVPSVRVISTFKESLNVFAHFGLGYHRMLFSAQRFFYMGTWNFSETKNTLGFSLGGGLFIGQSNKFQLEIFPLFSLLVNNSKYFSNYFTINIGFFSRGK